MGDRRMAEIKTEDGSLFVYAHWHGAELPDLAKTAVKQSAPRRGDTPYETRIIVDQLTADGRDQEIGFGLMLKPHAEDEYNNNKPSVIIDLITKELAIIGRNGKEEVLPFSEVESHKGEDK